MRYLAFATDYDGTLAHHGVVDGETVDALRRLKASGRKLILVTGRQMDDLARVFPELPLFDLVVGENGALIYRPERRETRRLADPPPSSFVEELRRRGVEPLAVGQVVVATEQPNERVVIEVIRELGLELQVIFNKGSVMVLPSSVNKASGLQAALDEFSLSPHNVVGIGDAENDHAFLSVCECGVAVANALDAVKQRADHVTEGRASVGVREVIEALISNDLHALEAATLRRHSILLGHAGDDPVVLSPYGSGVILAGPSGGGKSSLARGFLERLADQRYQFCIVDPEGDYDNFAVAVTIGAPDRPPTIGEVMRILEGPHENVAINLLGLRLPERPEFFEQLLPRVHELRARTGRPHWMVVDEAHHLLPSSWGQVDVTLPQALTSTLLITVHPEALAKDVCNQIDVVLAMGAPADVLRPFGGKTDVSLAPGEALIWSRRDGPPRRFRILPGQLERQRHLRKYAAGDLGPNAFYFRGPDGRLNLRAQNLAMFLQIADGVDDETWLHHLRRGDYARWFKTAIKDRELEAAARKAEALGDKPAGEGRRLIRDAIEQRYTAPA
ncbi:MAG: HAD-IIB family hydrolase [Chloroflexi bacterium]|nr:MAG: HAD-IIB family hydrolase [Chloroflexota bacterium]